MYRVIANPRASDGHHTPEKRRNIRGSKAAAIVRGVGPSSRR
jgi:hypothetical protein